MKRFVIITLFALSPLATFAQSNKTVETQKDRYGHITGTATTTTDSRGNQKTVYKDQYGHITGTSEARPTFGGRVQTTYKDRYGHITGSSETRSSYGSRTTTTYKDRYGHITGSSETQTNNLGSLLRLTKTNMDIYRVQAIRIDNDSKNRVAIQ